jgi:hypothetical protein
MSFLRREDIIKHLQKRIFELTGKNLPVYGVSTRNLSDFSTTEKDIMRDFSKVPSKEFRMWELDLDQSECREYEASIGET